MSRLKKEKINMVNIYINLLLLSIITCMITLLINSVQIDYAKISPVIVFVVILLITVAFIKHPPLTTELTINSKYIQTPDLVLNLNQLQDIYILSPIRKVLLTFVFGPSSYASSLLLPGLLLTVNNESHVFDLNKYTQKLLKNSENNLPSTNKLLSIIFFITLLIIPQIMLYLSKMSVLDPIFSLLIFVIMLKEIKDYFTYIFASEELLPEELHNIGINIKIPPNIEIRKGLTTLGAQNPLRMIEGVSLSYIVKKYIILSKEIINYNNNNYKKYILLHELGHAINNHGAFFFLFKILPEVEIPKHLPDYTGVLIVIAVFIIAIFMFRTKRQEEVADKFAVSVMGKENVINVLLIHKANSKNLFNWINLLTGYPSIENRIEKIKSMREDD